MTYTRGKPAFFVNISATALALVIAVIYAVYASGNKTFLPSVFVMFLLGAACGVAMIFVDFPLLPLAPCAFWSLAFSFFFADRLMMFGDYLNGLPGLSGGGNILPVVFIILIGTVLCVAAEAVVCFLDKRKGKN